MTSILTAHLAAPTTRGLACALAILLGPAAACRRAPASPDPAANATPAPAVTAAPPAHAADAGYELRAPEKAAVDAFLRANPQLRLAADGDHRPDEEGTGVGDLYGVYHPYLVRGDGNDDGLLDFVAGFVRRDSDKDAAWFSVVIFAGKPDGSFAAGSFVEREISLADGDISLDRDTIVVTPDVADDISRRYRWDPARQRHVFVRDDASEESVSPPPSQI
jgi:hypothetical protein